MKNNKLIYQGYFYENKYEGKGCLYFENKKIYKDGLFKDDNLVNGILYDPDGNKIYSGNFINNNPKEGKI